MLGTQDGSVAKFGPWAILAAAASIADHLWLMGRDRQPDGSVIPGARIVEVYDLVERGLCWHPDLTLTPEFGDFLRELRARVMTL